MVYVCICLCFVFESGVLCVILITSYGSLCVCSRAWYAIMGVCQCARYIDAIAASVHMTRMQAKGMEYCTVRGPPLRGHPAARGLRSWLI